MLRFALFDLDDTLYGAETGLWPAIGHRIELFMVERLGLAAAEVRALRHQYFLEFGTTLNGLRQYNGVDPDDYLAFVHAVPLEQYLAPNPALDQMLARLPLTKAIFTNADAGHARRVIQRLDIARHFQSIVDIRTLGFVNKPDPRAYQLALGLLGADPRACVLVDDAVRNLVPAHALGMLTVLVGPASEPAPGVDYVIPNILSLEAALIHSGRLAAAQPQAREAA
jgi:putative hydrolase of the HAD superfamily